MLLHFTLFLVVFLFHPYTRSVIIGFDNFSTNDPYYADCIGSAFNMKGAMQCPNCRKVEKGQWLYANGSTRSLPELSMEDWNVDDDYYDQGYSEMVLTKLPMFSMSLYCCLLS